MKTVGDFRPFQLLESKAHLVPYSISVYRFFGDAFVCKTKLGVIRYQTVFAGENKAFSLLLPGGVNGILNQLSCITLATIGGKGINPKDHLPGTMRVMQRGFSYISSYRSGSSVTKPSTKAIQFFMIEHQPEMITVIMEFYQQILLWLLLQQQENSELLPLKSVKDR